MLPCLEFGCSMRDACPEDNDLHVHDVHKWRDTISEASPLLRVRFKQGRRTALRAGRQGGRAGWLEGKRWDGGKISLWTDSHADLGSRRPLVKFGHFFTKSGEFRL